MKEAWIIGSGPAGLCMAYHLQQRGVSCTVISADAEPGGLAGPRQLADRLIDPGPHSFYTSYAREAFSLLHAMFEPSELHWITPHKLIRAPGFVCAVPPRLTDLRQPRLVLAAARMVVQPRLPQLFRPRTDGSAGQRVRSLRGRTFHDLLFDPWCRKQFGVSSDRLDPDLSDMLALTRRQGDDGLLVHPCEGAIGELWTRLARHLSESGVRFRYREPVRGMTVQAGRVTAIETAAGSIPIEGQVFTSTPLQAVAAWTGVRPQPGAALRSTILLLFTVSRCRRSELYLTDHCLDEPLCRLTFCDNWRAAPERDGRAVLCAEFWCSPGEPIHDAPTGQLLEHVQRYVRKHRLAVPDRNPEHLRIGPLRTTPVPLIGYRQQQEALRASLPTLKNLHPIGRHAAHRWDGVDDAIVETKRLAQAQAMALN